MFAGFHWGAFLVRTLSGKIQLSRLERADQNYRAFDDEAKAIAFLRDTLAGGVAWRRSCPVTRLTAT